MATWVLLWLRALWRPWTAEQKKKEPQTTRNGPEFRSSTPPVNTNRSAYHKFYLSCGVLKYKDSFSKIVFHDWEKHHSGFLPENTARLPDIYRRYLKVIYSTQRLGTFSLCLLTSALVSVTSSVGLGNGKWQTGQELPPLPTQGTPRASSNYTLGAAALSLEVSVNQKSIVHSNQI